MTRDMDLVRAILLKMEAGPLTIANHRYLHIVDFPDQQVQHNFWILKDAGFIVQTQVHSGHYRLSWQGHEFLDNIRDDDVWNKTKDGAKRVGGFSLELIADLAKGLLKKKISEHTGVEL
ncbi:MAG TPA: DUF2513 domain-containing protein [Xanthobacteraceae bacterium]|nr:DUF2513 domain-containing protein [Xanthobacteraceae bacterium]